MDADHRKRALVTGLRPGGIGEAEARRLSFEGWRVLAAERSEDSAALAAENLKREGIDLPWVHADLGDPAAIPRVFHAVERYLGGLDLLVNNAGSAGDAVLDRLEDLSADDLVCFFRTNLVSTFLATKRAVLDFFAPQGSGVVVFTSSCNGLAGYGHWNQLGYAISKAGLDPMLNILTAEYGPRGIRFYLVRPSIVETNSPNWMRRRLLDPAWSNLEGSMIPCGRLPRPSDIAAVVAFLATSEAAYLSGNEIRLDGGMLRVGIGVPGIDSYDPRHSYVEVMRSLRGKVHLGGKAAQEVKP